MNVRFFLAAAILGSWMGCQCGGPVDPCLGVRCATGLTCEDTTGRCIDPLATTGGGAGGGIGGGTGGGTGGGAADAGAGCTPACDASRPVCDEANNRCVICTDVDGCGGATPYCELYAHGGLGRCLACTATEGCIGATPFCDLTVGAAGTCVGCRTHNDCTTQGTECDFVSHTCVTSGTGGGAGGGTGGGGGGNTGVVQWGDGGVTQRCLPFTGGTGKSCTTECDRGFVCVGGFCELRGSSGEVQVTLRFPQDEDLDLHLVEPLPNGGTCEIYYQQPGNTPDAGPLPFPLPFPLPTPPTCGALGWLDLDSNPACTIDGVNIENIIYAPTTAVTPGQYIVRVDYYEACGASAPIPYEVEVRAMGQRQFFCGTFTPSDADHGNGGAGRTITTFTIR